MGKILRAQVAYGNSPTALATAQATIAAKIRNAELVFGSYRQSRERAGDERAKLFLAWQNKLTGLRQKTDSAPDKKSLFLIEARAGALYWQGFRLICHLDQTWRRFYPHAKDSANLLLNSGYTFLARKCREALSKAGLILELGFYHGDNSGQALVYDLMEPFRVLAVDLVMMPIFSRRSRSGVAIDDKVFKKALARLAARYRVPLWYHGRCEKLERILYLEAVRLRRTIVAGEVWQPYQYRWGHRRRCQ